MTDRGVPEVAVGLYALPPGEFVAARDALVRDLRAGGDRATAAAVKALRRPTVAAWALNQVARAEPDVVTTVLEAAEALRHAQRRVLSGLRDTDLRGAGTAHRQATDQLVAAAVAVAARHGSTAGATLEAALRATVQAASVDDEVARALRDGTLERELPAPDALGGFGGLEGLTLVPTPTPAEEADLAADDDGDDARAEQRAAAQRELMRANTALQEAQAAAKATADEAATARRRAEELAAAAEAARRRAEAAARAAERAAEEARAAREEADRAARAAERAERAAAEAADRRERAVADAETAIAAAEALARNADAD